MTKVVTEKPELGFNKLAKELIYGFIAYLIVFLLDLAFTWIGTTEYAYLIPIIDAFEHMIMKFLEEFDLEYSQEFVPFYKKIIIVIKTTFIKVFKKKSGVK